MHKFYFFLHIILGTAAIAGTVWGWKSFQETTNTVNDVKEEKTSVNISPGKLETADSNRSNGDNERSFPNKNILWEKFLFSPQRNEGVDISVSNNSEQERGKVDMELVGTGSLGSKSAAIIFVKQQGRNKKRDNRNLYLKGAQVEDTGYKVDEITLNEVFLVRADGEEERILRIHRQDDASQERSKKAVKHAAKARQEREKEKEREKEQKKDKEGDKKVPKPPSPPARGVEGEEEGEKPPAFDEREEQPPPSSPEAGEGPPAFDEREEQPPPSSREAGEGPPAPSERKTQESEEQVERLREREERLEKLREVIKKRREEIQ